jgi:hypothetical protein
MENIIQIKPKPENESFEPGRGIALKELVKKAGSKLEQPIQELLILLLEQHENLADIEITPVSPKLEPNTGGVFDKYYMEDGTIIPTVFIVEDKDGHMRKMMQNRKKSVLMVAEMLGIEPEEMSPEILKQFIVAHEFGHATDYVKNYQNNPE